MIQSPEKRKSSKTMVHLLNAGVREVPCPFCAREVVSLVVLENQFDPQVCDISMSCKRCGEHLLRLEK